MQPDKVSTEPVEAKMEERSISGLLAKLTQDIATLVQQEVQLARAEVSEKISQVSSGIASSAIGGAILFAGILVILQAAVYGLHDAIKSWSPGMWLAPLIIGEIVTIVGFGLLQKGRSNLQPENLAPRKTVRSLREDKEFVKNKMQ